MTATELLEQDVVACPTVRDVQRDLLEHIENLTSRIGGRVFFADLISSPRPTLWFCGTPEQGAAFRSEMLDQHFGFAEPGRRHLAAAREPIEGAFVAIAFSRYASGKREVHGVTSGVAIEFCRYSEETGCWTASRAGLESEASEDYLQSLEPFEYLGATFPILGNCRAVWDRHPAAAGVDLVYTWVDGSDPEWQARKSGVQYDGSVPAADDQARYIAGQELFYSLLSAERYFVDLGHIYVVTDAQIPTIPDALRARVTFVDHKDIFENADHLPTFNSHSIGAQLHRIPGLRQQYLYLNDDVLFGRPVAASAFYDELGRSYQFHSTRVSTPYARTGPHESAVNIAARNNRELLKQKFDIHAFRKFKHTPVATDRDLMFQMREELPEAWEATLPNRYRSPDDFAIAGHLYAHYAACKGRSVVGNIVYAYFDLGSPDFIRRFYGRMDQTHEPPSVFCINETTVTEYSEENREFMDQVLMRAYPTEGVRRTAPFVQRMTGTSGIGTLVKRGLKRVLPASVVQQGKMALTRRRAKRVSKR